MITPSNLEELLLEIIRGKHTREQVANMYVRVQALKACNKVNWKKIHSAISHKWGSTSLEYVLNLVKEYSTPYNP